MAFRLPEKKENTMTIPNPKQIHPLKSGLKSVTYIQPTITRPNVIVGEFSYFAGENFEAQVTHHYDFIGDKLIIGKFCQIAAGVEFVMNADIRTKEDADRLTAEYDAVALCCGAKKARPLSAKGATLSTTDASTGSECNRFVGGIMFAVDWLKSVTKSLL